MVWPALRSPAKHQRGGRLIQVPEDCVTAAGGFDSSVGVPNCGQRLNIAKHDWARSTRSASLEVDPTFENASVLRFTSLTGLKTLQKLVINTALFWDGAF